MKHAVINTTLEGFIGRRTRASYPIPLKSTSYEIEIVSGLAVVRLIRKFVNVEKRPIEATITFPVPFDAAVSKIETKIDDRVLVGKAQAKTVARETYETAIDGGKPAVLHEELLRGLHMLSVANVAPGAKIEVTATFSVPLVLVDGGGKFRIPVTVGQIYGELPLMESDQLVTDGPVTEAKVKVKSKGTVLINGDAATKTKVKLDSPIIVKVAGLYNEFPSDLIGRAADGRAVKLSFLPLKNRNTELDIDIVLDVSGSMKERIESNPEGNSSKWDAVKSGLAFASDGVLKNEDKVNLWVFSNDCRKVDRVRGDKLAAVVGRIPFSGGGTELPGAIATVSASRSETNVLLVTDGQSGHKIDIQAAVASGARFTVVLVGESALEVNVGYLAAMTGGQMFIVSGSDTHQAISAAVASMRNVPSPVREISGKPHELGRVIGGTLIEAKWFKATKEEPNREGVAEAVAAYAAHLAIQGMKEEDAAKFAEAEGIVSHLTSIVLVDDAADAVKGIPATRKVPLAQAATTMSFMASAGPVLVGSALRSMARGIHLNDSASLDWASASLSSAGGETAPKNGLWGGLYAGKRKERDDFSIGRIEDLMITPPSVVPTLPDVSQFHTLVASIDWNAQTLNIEDCLEGNVDSLSYGIFGRMIVEAIKAIAAMSEVKLLADSLGKTSTAVALALVALSDASSDRSAGRFAAKVLKGADKKLQNAAFKASGLKVLTY